MTARRWITAAALGAAALLIPAAGANAKFIYSTNVSVANSPSLPPPPGVTSQIIDIGNGNSLRFVGASTATPLDQSAPGGADLNFGAITFLPSADNNTATAFNVNYDFQLSITDQTTGVTKTVDYTGFVDGTAVGGAVDGISISSLVHNTGITPTTLDFGNGITYNLIFKAGVGPGSGTAGPTSGTLQGNANGVVPEPSSFALMSIGGLVFGLVARRRMAKPSTV